MSSTTTPARRRNVALVALDIAVSALALFFAFGLGLTALAFVTQITAVSRSCGADGSCNTTLLGVAGYGLLAVTILAFFLGLGFTIVRIIQKRLTFPWAVGALVVMLLGFYAATFLAGSAVVPA